MPIHSFGDDLHQIARQCDERVARQKRKLAALKKAPPTADTGAEEEMLLLLMDTQREAHQALERYLAGRE